MLKSSKTSNMAGPAPPRSGLTVVREDNGRRAVLPGIADLMDMYHCQILYSPLRSQAEKDRVMEELGNMYSVNAR